MNRFEFLGLMILSCHDSVFLVGLAQSSWEFQNQPDSNREFTPINANEAFRFFRFAFIREGMRFVSGVLKHSGSSCRTDGKWITIRTCWLLTSRWITEDAR